MLCEYITILDSFLFVMKSMLVIENCWTDVIYSFDWYGLSPFTIHTGLSGEDLELRHTVFWCIYPSSRGDLFIRGTNYFFVNFLMIWYFVSFLTFLKVKLLLVYIVFSAHIMFHWPKTMRYVTMLLITLSEKKLSWLRYLRVYNHYFRLYRWF